jgi:hypothetical protein
VPLEAARRSALGHLLDTFFEGSMESVVATMLKMKKKKIDPDEAARIARMIEDAASKGR